MFVVLFYLSYPFSNVPRRVPAADSSRDMSASANMAATPGQVQDYVKLFKAERDNLEYAEGVYSWVGKDVEHRVLRKYGKLHK